MKATVLYEINALYCDSTIYGSYKKDEELSVPLREIDAEKAEKFIKMLLEMGAKHYETSKAHFYETTIDARHIREYVFFK
jgi:hypothetical protein